VVMVKLLQKGNTHSLTIGIVPIFLGSKRQVPTLSVCVDYDVRKYNSSNSGLAGQGI